MVSEPENITGNNPSAETAPADMALVHTDAETLTITLSGSWKLDRPQPAITELQQTLESSKSVKRLRFNTDDLAEWDSSLLTFLIKIKDLAGARQQAMDNAGLPEGARRLLRMAQATPKREGVQKEVRRQSLLAGIGSLFFKLTASSRETLTFLGEASIALLRFVSGRARYRRADLLLIIQETGAEALPIVSLISILIGLILAYVGAYQLALFGAQIYVADLVAIGMLREMGAMMTGVIMAGRTGAAFAARLGTMQVNEEIDALQTLGIPPMEFLVLPRIVALVVMMPLLCIYADLMGLIGGALVGIGVFDLTPTAYLQQSSGSLTVTHFGIGVFKSIVFGFVIALAGCLRGMQSGRSASAVGYAATSAVVTSITIIIALDGLFAVMTNVLGI
jgi:phospholipid/cholesterol/gamma-HCH transport system permease protein